MKIQSKVATILKGRLAPSNELFAYEKINITKGQNLQVASVTAAPNQHLLLELSNHQFKRGYVYAPHWTYPDDEIILPASYYYQRDNPSGEGPRECCGTSNAIMLNYVLGGKLDTDAKRQGVRQPESYYLTALREEGDSTDHDANTRTLRKFGVESFWSTSLTLEDFYLSIRHNLPLVMGLDYKGPNQGHVACGVGYKLKKRVAVLHDPNGSRLGATDEWISNSPEAGAFDIYGIETLEIVWFPRGSLGWGRLITHIHGEPTIFAA